MTKIIFKFTMAVTSAIGSYAASDVKIQMPQLPKPEIRVEKTQKIDSLKQFKLVENKKTALS